MSQAKVDRYKEEKKNRKKTMAPAHGDRLRRFPARCCLRLAGCHRARRLGWCVRLPHL